MRGSTARASLIFASARIASTRTVLDSSLRASMSGITARGSLISAKTEAAFACSAGSSSFNFMINGSTAGAPSLSRAFAAPSLTCASSSLRASISGSIARGSDISCIAFTVIRRTSGSLFFSARRRVSTAFLLFNSFIIFCNELPAAFWTLDFLSLREAMRGSNALISFISPSDSAALSRTTGS